MGLPIPSIRQYGPAASAVILVEGESNQVVFDVSEQVLRMPDTQLRLFGKPEVSGKRRMGVALALANDVAEAVTKAKQAADCVSVEL